MNAAIQLIDYSDKAIAVIGDTKSIKDQLKDLGGRFNFRLSCGAGWIFPKTKEAQIKAILNGEVLTVEQTEPNNSIFVETLKEFASKQKDPDYYLKGNAGALKIGEHYFLIDKPIIKKDFCFHDEGYQYEQYKELTSCDNKMQTYFLIENLNRFTELINDIKQGNPIYIDKSSYKDRFVLQTHYAEWRENEQANEQEREQILQALEFGKSEFEKRLNSYLKKYGVSKLKVSTFWADR